MHDMLLRPLRSAHREARNSVGVAHGVLVIVGLWFTADHLILCDLHEGGRKL